MRIMVEALRLNKENDGNNYTKNDALQDWG